jgi:hypothetical protein
MVKRTGWKGRTWWLGAIVAPGMALGSCNLVIGLEAGERATATTGTSSTGGSGATGAGGSTGGGPTCTGGGPVDGHHLWSKNYGDGAQQESEAIAVAPDGSVLVTGGIQGTVDFGSSFKPSGNTIADDIFVLKLDPNGNTLWAKRFGQNDAHPQRGFGIAVDAGGNVFVTGSVQGQVDFGTIPLQAGEDDDIFVAMLDPGGTVQWAKLFGGALAQAGTGIAVDRQGAVLVTGRFEGTVDFGGQPIQSGGGQDAFVLKLTAAGDHVWSQGWGDGQQQAGTGIATDSSRNVIVTGWFAGQIQHDLLQLGPADDIDVFVAKLDPAGGLLAGTMEGGPGDDRPSGVAVDSRDYFVVTGQYQHQPDFGFGALPDAGFEPNIFVVEYEPTVGNHVWSKGFGGAATQIPSGVAVDSHDDVVLTGLFSGSFDFGGPLLTSASVQEDIFVAKLDKDGAHLWSKRFGDGAFQFGKAVAVDRCDEVLTTGLMYGSFSFGGDTLTTAPSDAGIFPDDIYVVKLAP